MLDLTRDADLDAVLGEPEAVLLKHGAHCPISAAARAELKALAARRPDIPIAGLEVTTHLMLSEAVAAWRGVAHESPQAFVLRGGDAVWHATHFDITADAVERHLGGA